MPINIGDAELTFTAKTEKLDHDINELFDRIQRTVEAARGAWNAKPEEPSKAQ